MKLLFRLGLAGSAIAAAALADDSAPAVWTLHEQSTLIDQWHYGFPAPYSGPNSFQPEADSERSFSFSVFAGYQPWSGGGLFYNPEIFQGHGLSGTLGIAGFPNGEALKAAFPNLHYNTSRLYFQQVVGFGGGTEKVDDGPNQIAGTRDADRLTLTVGKFSPDDFFDDNTYSHDSRGQFMNWALWESGAWDVPSEALGYTGGFVAEWTTPAWTIHYGLMMVPTVSNGPTLNTNLTREQGQILQFDRRYPWNGHPGTVRTFVYWNRADMGNFRDTLANPADDADITRTRAVRSKVGAGLSWDQELSSDLGAFARLSWDDGRTETWAFSEIDRSVAAGLSLKGSRWGRSDDVAGLAGVVNGLSSDHRAYLAAGGTGMILGDGRLSYGPEEIVEAYYDAQVCHWLWLTPDFQYVEHPGYNTARGGVAIYAVRAHVEF
jgi:high affinity Mn2+ porin